MKIIMCLRDTKSELFMQPFFVPTVGVAVRNLQDELSRGGDDNQLAKHPGDYQLYSLGVWDDETGMIDSNAKLVCNVESLASSNV